MRAGVLCSVVFLAACGGSGETTNAPSTRPLAIIAGAGATDTIDAVNRVHLTIRALDNSGAPLPNANISMQVRSPQNPPIVGGFTGSITSSSITTDAQGGTQLEQVATPSPGSLNGFREPSVSADGRQVVFVDGDARTYMIRDLVTGQQRTIAVAQGSNPLFSPDGKHIGYQLAALGMINVDGTGLAYFGCPASSCSGVGWTKDGQWMLTQAFDWIAMLNVTTGEWIRVPNTFGSYNISVQQ